MKPLIIISTGCGASNERNGMAQLSYSYVNSVLAAGGAPLLLAPIEDWEAVDRALDQADGLLLPGGPDLSPAFYGEEPVPMLEPASSLRKQFDVLLCRRAVERCIPMLGICLGCQVINVALGGSLIQDILTQNPASNIVHRRRVYPYFVPHAVRIERDSLFGRIAGAETIEVPSAHHQAIARLGKGLRASAWAPDGVVEVIEPEDPASPFILGIQWHPEKWAEHEPGPHRRIFEALIHAAQAARK